MGDGGRTTAIGSGTMTTGGWTMIGGSGMIGESSVRTARSSAVVGMVCWGSDSSGWVCGIGVVLEDGSAFVSSLSVRISLAVP